MSCADGPRGPARTATRPVGSAAVALLGMVLAGANAALAAGLSDIVVTPTAAQSPDQARRDRYECHNWVIAQNVQVPAPVSASPAAAADRRAERVDKVITGAAIGTAIGGFIGGVHDYRDAGDGALVGGMIGAIGGAAAGAKKNKEVEQQEDEVFAEYFRALDACMTARGYSLSVAGSDE